LATKAPKLTKEHGLIDWTRTAEQVCDQIRAMQPWPTAYTFLHRTGQPPLRLLITRAAPRLPTDREAVSVPGDILPHSEPTRFCVRAGDWSLVEVLELQPAGKKRMPAAEFLRGRRPQHDDRLGPEAS